MATTSALKMSQEKEMLREQWLRYFCSDEEYEQLLMWLQSEGLSRPLLFEDRIAHAARLRELGNDWYQRSDWRRALHCALGSIHSLDYKPAEQLGQSDEQRNQVVEGMLPVISNLAMILLKRGDFGNAAKAASVGLRCLEKLPKDSPTRVPFKVKLLYRRGLARGEPGPDRDLEGAREDLAKAAQLEPSNREIRICLDNCKELMRKEKEEAAAKQTAEAEAEARSKAGASFASSSSSSNRGGGAAGPEADQRLPPKEMELSPRALLFAEVVGRCLGRTRRRCRLARAYGKHATSFLFGSSTRLRLATIVVLGPALAMLTRGLLAALTPGAPMAPGTAAEAAMVQQEPGM